MRNFFSKHPFLLKAMLLVLWTLLFLGAMYPLESEWHAPVTLLSPIFFFVQFLSPEESMFFRVLLPGGIYWIVFLGVLFWRRKRRG